MIIDEKKVRNFLSGGSTAIPKIIIGYPFETLKTRVQINDTNFRTELLKFRNNPLNIYKGSGLFLISSFLKRSIQFTVFEEINIHSNSFVAGICGGVVSSALTNPVNIIKTNLQGKSEMKNTVECIKILYSKSGFNSFNKGYKINIIRDTLFSGCFLGTYGYFRNVFPKEPKFYALSGILASTTTWSILIPFDTYRTLLQINSNKTISEINNKIIENPIKLWKGFNIMLFRSIPINIFNMILYEFLRNR